MVPGMDTHGTPVPTQWEGRGWLDRTHEHMAPEHATDTNEPKTDTRSYKHGFGDPCAWWLSVLRSHSKTSLVNGFPC